jgi:excinuclease UvrABC nuclease subunit
MYVAKPKTGIDAKFPPVAGCYIIRHSGRVLYVGQSGNIWKRWLAHQHKWFIKKYYPDVDVEIIECGNRLETEGELIKTLKPIMNGKDNWYFSDVDKILRRPVSEVFPED